MSQTKIKKELIDASFGTDWVETIQTSNFTAVAGKGYFVNTTSAEITVTLPAGVVGAEIVIQDYAGTFATNKVIFASNGSEKIQGSTDDYRCITNNATVTLIYQDTTKGWNADNIIKDIAPLVVDYLVVAGGGGGCNNSIGGGGGAGGLRTSYGLSSGGGAGAETSLTLTPSTNYTITVGGGGGSITNGTNSVFATITSIGGGHGKDTGQVGTSGGSGGGSGYNTSSISSGTVNQGFAGGGGNLSSSPAIGGGGGGASEAGNTDGSGHGGDGLAVSITGSSVTYAGGGGGSRNDSTVSPGGDGGGGFGATQGIPSSAGNGTTNTGSGGGAGGGGTPNTGGTGGSGVVILRYPDTYTITIGSGLTGTTATDGSSKVTTFTAGTGNIQLT